MVDCVIILSVVTYPSILICSKLNIIKNSESKLFCIFGIISNEIYFSHILVLNILMRMIFFQQLRHKYKCFCFYSLVLFASYILKLIEKNLE